MQAARSIKPSPKRYRQEAERCADLAASVRDKTERKILLNIAGQYRRLANHKEKTRGETEEPVHAD